MPTLNDKQQQMRLALEQLGEGWHTRADVARHLHKKQLNPVEKAMLDQLAELGIAERTLRQAERFYANSWVYRIKQNAR